ncbi:S1 RNA-binding domain-containing protein [Kitasatospora phosalacinea]|uniref:S1 RNA-binding domain-containing protein n=1 Tax=Kitasatospora phosalacinea TaxID=2065 RepID=UPI00068AE2C2|nr:S1 RNA-binding domain-containing protein [Kitasatospora phosalacinea]
MRQSAIESPQPGEVRTGIVRSVAHFGVLVDIGGGVEGLVTVPQVSWKRLSDLSEVAEVGAKVNVVVLGVDPERGDVSLSIKDLLPDPLQDFARTTRLGQRIQARVTTLAPIGFFVEVAEGIQALVPVSDYAGRTEFGPQVGDDVLVEVRGVNLYTRRVTVALAVGG